MSDPVGLAIAVVTALGIEPPLRFGWVHGRHRCRGRCDFASSGAAAEFRHRAGPDATIPVSVVMPDVVDLGLQFRQDTFQVANFSGLRSGRLRRSGQG